MPVFRGAASLWEGGIPWVDGVTRWPQGPATVSVPLHCAPDGEKGRFHIMYVLPPFLKCERKIEWALQNIQPNTASPAPRRLWKPRG